MERVWKIIGALALPQSRVLSTINVVEEPVRVYGQLCDAGDAIIHRTSRPSDIVLDIGAHHYISCRSNSEFPLFHNSMTCAYFDMSNARGAP
ncbi:hypothetical protein BofuT4_uP033090.1 [Botrytis cinerea T4]|uniref:Uncharacterized protein n=1 Tax=Botryotinia fuckeliana (strain T4) TaxID=999810 RepID=G2Y7T9_BOTF4|nr:hypothetical protein BofuT4_uP033090.1 [Botrytis cinerea T4]